MLNTRRCDMDQHRSVARKHLRIGLLAVVLLSTHAGIVRAQQPAPATKPSMDIYGFTMLDMGEDLNTINPDWFDVMRPTKLPSFPGEFGEYHNLFAGVRQTRFGVKTTTPTKYGDMKTTFEFELFGVGIDAGQTTFRLRHAYGELGQFRAGQTWSPFMDPDVFPNSLEYWGPPGMVFYRNVQVAWLAKQGDTSVTIALERPGASGDNGATAGLVALQDVRSRFPWPDVTGDVKWGGHDWGYLRVAGAFRKIDWDDLVVDSIDLDGHAWGWGVNLSSNVNIGANQKNVLKMQAVYGHAIGNYMNDAPVDIGAELNLGDPTHPVTGKALPVLGLLAFLDHKWNDKWSSTGGYSIIDVDNSSGQLPNAFKRGQYALANIIYYPVENAYVGVEYQWGKRTNNSDGFKQNGNKFQVSFKYNFSYKLGG